MDRRKNLAAALPSLVSDVLPEGHDANVPLGEVSLDAHPVFEVPAQPVQEGHRQGIAGPETGHHTSCQPARRRVRPVAMSEKIRSPRMPWSASRRSWVSRFLASSSDLLTRA